jgi:phosphomannomutase
MTKTIVLFDIDGTLTRPRLKIDQKMLDFLKVLRNKVTIGFAGGSDMTKAKEQVGDNILDIFDYGFFENGLVAYKNQELIGIQNLKKYLDENRIKKFMNFILHYIADLDIPVKRGTFIEFRNGMINISPIGRNCSQEERNDFEKYDKTHKIRETMIDVLEKEFADYVFHYSIGGQISFDCFVKGWDKTFSLNYLNDFDTIYFFGDKTHKGGNDHEIYESERTIGYTVTSPDDTINKCKQIFSL